MNVEWMDFGHFCHFAIFAIWEEEWDGVWTGRRPQGAVGH